MPNTTLFLLKQQFAPEMPTKCLLSNSSYTYLCPEIKIRDKNFVETKNFFLP